MLLGFIILVGVVVLIAIKGYFDAVQYNRELEERLTKEYGNHKNNQNHKVTKEGVPFYFHSTVSDTNQIDGITWNDLDMDTIFNKINHTETSIGEEYLYRVLRIPQVDQKELVERDRVATYFEENEQDRIKVEKVLAGIGKSHDQSVYQSILKARTVNVTSSFIHIGCNIGLLVAVLSFSIHLLLGFILTTLAMGTNIIIYFIYRNRNKQYISLLAYILRLLYGAKCLGKLEIEQISDYLKQGRDIQKIFSKFKRGSFLLFSGRNGGNSILEFFLVYFRMFFHFDLLTYNSMMKQLILHEKEVLQLYETIGFLDSMRTVASFRASCEFYSRPIFLENKEPTIQVTELVHPLLEKPVAASFSENKCLLITGSNASGKSTFLKSVAINAILAQTIYTCMAKEYKANQFQIYSSMALHDNIFENESYFIVEIKSLKRIIERLSKEVPMLCFVDEVLRGTNTPERIAASAQILLDIGRHNGICLAATHDIELTHMIESCYTNYHFSETIQDEMLWFSYELHKGRTTTRNAIRLLSLLGYKEEIVQAANQTIEEYERTGFFHCIDRKS